MPDQGPSSNHVSSRQTLSTSVNPNNLSSTGAASESGVCSTATTAAREPCSRCCDLVQHRKHGTQPQEPRPKQSATCIRGGGNTCVLDHIQGSEGSD